VNDDQTALLISTHKAVHELSEHLRNAMLDNDKRDQDFELIQLGFQNNVVAQQRIADALFAIGKDGAKLRERSAWTVALAAVVPVLLLAIGIIHAAGVALRWLGSSSQALAMLGLGP
jgi:hypothetical protein